MKQTMETYEAPMVEVIEVEVEKGFAASLNTELINEPNEEIEW